MKSISVCPQGHVALRFGVATIHLTFDEFQDFIKNSMLVLEQYNAKTSLENSLSFQKTDLKIH